MRHQGFLFYGQRKSDEGGDTDLIYNFYGLICAIQKIFSHLEMVEWSVLIRSIPLEMTSVWDTHIFLKLSMLTLTVSPPCRQSIIIRVISKKLCSKSLVDIITCEPLCQLIVVQELKSGKITEVFFSRGENLYYHQLFCYGRVSIITCIEILHICFTTGNRMYWSLGKIFIIHNNGKQSLTIFYGNRRDSENKMSVAGSKTKANSNDY